MKHQLFITVLITVSVIVPIVLIQSGESQASDNNNELTECLKGKTVSIMGDSITAYYGTVPDGYVPSYIPEYALYNGGISTADRDGWWPRLLDATDSRLGINSSESGSMVGYYNWVPESNTKNINKAMANYNRISELDDNGQPDLIIIYGGTNDYYWSSDKIGSFDDTVNKSMDDLMNAVVFSSVVDAYYVMLNRILCSYPDSTVVCMMPYYVKSHYSDETCDEGNEELIRVCNHCKVNYIDLRCCGIDKDSDLFDGLHPNLNGFEKIYHFVASKLCEMITTVSFDFCDDKGVSDTILLFKNTVIKDIDNPHREGFQFEGWYFDSGYQSKYDGEIIVNDCVLYAKWSDADESNSSDIDNNEKRFDSTQGFAIVLLTLLEVVVIIAILRSSRLK